MQKQVGIHMAKSLLYRIFGLGRIPAAQRWELQSEGELLCEEGLRASITYRHFHAPGKYFRWRKKWALVGSIVLTQKRLAVFLWKRAFIIIAYDDPRMKEIAFEGENSGSFSLTCNASMLDASWSGTIELRFSTAEATRIMEIIERRPG